MKIIFRGAGRRLDITIFFRYDSCERTHRFHRDCPCIQGVEHEAKRIFSPAIDYHRPPTVFRDRRLKSLSPARLGWSTLGSRSVQDEIKSRQESKGGETWRPFVKTKPSRTIFNVGTRTRVFIPSPQIGTTFSEYQPRVPTCSHSFLFPGREESWKRKNATSHATTFEDLRTTDSHEQVAISPTLRTLSPFNPSIDQEMRRQKLRKVGN